MGANALHFSYVAHFGGASGYLRCLCIIVSEISPITGETLPFRGEGSRQGCVCFELRSSRLCFWCTCKIYREKRRVFLSNTPSCLQRLLQPGRAPSCSGHVQNSGLLLPGQPCPSVVNSPEPMLQKPSRPQALQSTKHLHALPLSSKPTSPSRRVSVTLNDL